jgi:hypothetical protein
VAPSKPAGVLAAVLIGTVAAALFVSVCSPNLGGQGLYQDEVLQAAQAFAYVGGESIAALSVHGVPLLNNPYLGAIKTGLYGMYMRLTGSGFSVVSWRMLGILIVAAGILLFPLLSRRVLRPLPAALFLAFVITDGAVILSTRHDWGPTALALLFRLLIIGLLFGDDQDAHGLEHRSALLGLIFGLAVFEKLSSVVLLAPLALAVLLQPLRRKPRALAALAAGGMVGFLPLLAVNVLSYFPGRLLISLQEVIVQHKPSLWEFVTSFPRNYLSLSSAPFFREWILGRPADPSLVSREILLVGALVAVTLGLAVWHFRQGAEFRLAAVLCLSYFGVALLLHLLPRRTADYHMIQVIPFHYAAAAAALAGLMRLRKKRLGIALLTAACGLVMAQHLVTAKEITGDLLAGRASRTWDRAFTLVGNFANSQRDKAVFIAAAWGVGAPIYCLSQGRPGLRYEVFWDYRGPQQLRQIPSASRREIVYIVTPVSFLGTETPSRINRDAGFVPGWKEVRPEPEAAALRDVILVRKFVTREASVAGH